MKLTTKEQELLIGITTNSFTEWNYSTPPADELLKRYADIANWSDCLDDYTNCTMENKELRGVLSSLIKKGLAWSDGAELVMKERCFGITKAGAELVIELRK